MNVKSATIMGPICGYCKRCKKPTVIMETICEYCKECKKKPNDYNGSHMRVLQRMKNVNDYLWPICGYCNEWRMSTIICDLYAGIARNAKCQHYYGTHMWVLHGMQNAINYYGTYMGVLQWMQNACGYFWTYMRVLHIWKWFYGVHNREWCRYYMFKMCGLF